MSEKSIDLVIDVVFCVGLLFFIGAPIVLVPRWLNKKGSDRGEGVKRE